MHTLAKQEDLIGLRNRLLTVRATDRGRWGVMSAGQMLCHLRGAFLVAMGELPCDPIRLASPAKVMKAFALWAPVPWKQNFETVPALKLGAPVMITGSFQRDRESALEAMDRFCRPTQQRVDHAFFGTMSMADWMRWGFLHTDHHLRQFGR